MILFLFKFFVCFLGIVDGIEIIDVDNGSDYLIEMLIFLILQFWGMG